MCLEAVFLVQIRLERRRVLADVVPESGEMSLVAGLKSCGKLCCHVGDAGEMVFQSFPFFDGSISQ
jgi:hypothetical protein